MKLLHKTHIYKALAAVAIVVAAPLLAFTPATKNSVSDNQKFEVKKVDFDEIKAAIVDPKSKFYYPKLMKSFQSNDTTMSFEQYRYLYFGYVFSEDYSPLRQSEFSDKIESLYYKGSYTRAECDTIEKYAELSLDDNIFDLQQMEFYIYSLKEKRKHARASIRQYRLNHIMAAILSSGNGTQESPWVVISAEHEYYIINKLGYVATAHQELDGYIDYIEVEKRNANSPEGFYFDASKMVEVGQIKFAQ